jgi:hypothetical protein
LKAKFPIAYQQSEIEANNNSIGYGDCSKFNITKMASESLGDDVHGESGHPAEDSRPNDFP